MIPVSNISVVGANDSNDGASRWIGQRSVSSGSALAEVDRSPSTLKIRPSVARPTGTEIGAPVSITSTPRASPSVVSIATARTRSSPRCCCTSQTRYSSWAAAMSSSSSARGGLGALDEDRVVDLRQLVVEHRLDHDALDLLDPPDVALALGALGVFFGRYGHAGVSLSEAFRAGHDFHDLLGDLGLAGSVHLQGVVVDQG